MNQTPSSGAGEGATADASRHAPDWLSYYSECRQYELVMGEKFTSLLGHASVFSFAAATGIFTLADKLKESSPDYRWVAIPTSIGLIMYAAIILKYFMQIRYTGNLMLKLEVKVLGDEAERLGLLHVLRSPRSAFYARPWAFPLVWLYVLILIFLPWAAVLSVS